MNPRCRFRRKLKIILFYSEKKLLTRAAAPIRVAAQEMSLVPFVRLWIWLSAFASLAGWALSAAGQLNRAGYSAFFAAVVVIIFLWRRKAKQPTFNIQQPTSKGIAPSDFIGCSMLDVECWLFPKKLFRRCRRLLPFCFAALAGLIFLGGALYPPTNYTGVTYHVPRVLQWLAHEQWCWIHTADGRKNFSGCAFEWVIAPLLLFTKSDRALFLINFISFLLMPGLVFSVFTRLGVRARVAQQWMWLLPTGYIFLLQAGSIGNDAFSAIYALAAIDFGCRAWESRRVRDLWLSLLAVALLTGTKPISLPLLLPWVVLVFRLLPLLWRNWLPTLPVLVVAGVASFFPIALMNKLHCGDWLGRAVEAAHLEIHQRWFGIFGNAFQVLLGNFTPPVFPLAGWWNLHAPLFMPHWMVEAANTNFDKGFFLIGELPTEDWAGIGFGVSWLLLVSVLASFWIRGTAPQTPVHRSIPFWLCRCVLVAAWFSLMAYSMKSGLTTVARLITPYYVLLVPSLLVGAGPSQIIRRGWWRVMVGVVMGLALVVLVLSPDRPLWPAKTILSKVLERHPDQHSVARALQVYTVYSERSDGLACVRALLPAENKIVGFIANDDDCDISLWRPFGTRRVEHFLLTDPPEQIRRQVQYAVVGGYYLQAQGTTLDAWLQASGAKLVATTNVTLKIGQGMQPWSVVRFQP